MTAFEPLRLPPVSGHAHRVVRRRGAVWYVKYRVPDPTRRGRVRQVRKLLGPEWPAKGPPPPGYYDRRSAQAALEAILTDARRGAIEFARTGVTFEQAASEWLRWGEHERGWKRSTLVDRRSVLERHLLPEFGALPINQITTRRVEAWKIRWLAGNDARRQGAKLFEILHGHGAVTTTKGGRARAVPLVAEVAQALARLGQRDYATGPDDPVFPGEVAGHLDASALRRRFVVAREAAGLRPLRFHDLRHTFGSLAINRASIVQVQAWMGHADAKTTMRYLHHKSQEDEAELLAGAFRPTAPPDNDRLRGSVAARTATASVPST